MPGGIVKYPKFYLADKSSRRSVERARLNRLINKEHIMPQQPQFPMPPDLPTNWPIWPKPGEMPSMDEMSSELDDGSCPDCGSPMYMGQCINKMCKH